MPFPFSPSFLVYWSTQLSRTWMEGKLVFLSTCVPNGPVNSPGKQVPLFPSCIHGNWDSFKVTHPESCKDRIAKQISSPANSVQLGRQMPVSNILSEKHPHHFLNEASSFIASPLWGPFLTLSSCPRFLGVLRFFLFVFPTISGYAEDFLSSGFLLVFRKLANAFLNAGQGSLTEKVPWFQRVWLVGASQYGKAQIFPPLMILCSPSLHLENPGVQISPCQSTTSVTGWK